MMATIYIVSQFFDGDSVSGEPVATNGKTSKTGLPAILLTGPGVAPINKSQRSSLAWRYENSSYKNRRALAASALPATLPVVEF